jgi:hypothetical protein
LDPDCPAVFDDDFLDVRAEGDAVGGFGGLLVFGLGVFVDGEDEGVDDCGRSSDGVVELGACFCVCACLFFLGAGREYGRVE